MALETVNVPFPAGVSASLALTAGEQVLGAVLKTAGSFPNLQLTLETAADDSTDWRPVPGFVAYLGGGAFVPFPEAFRLLPAATRLRVTNAGATVDIGLSQLATP